MVRTTAAGPTVRAPNNLTEDIYYGYRGDSFSMFGAHKFTAGVRLEHSNARESSAFRNPSQELDPSVFQ